MPPDDPYIQSGSKYHEERYGERRRLDLTPYGKADWTSGEQTDLVIHEACRSLRHSKPKIGQLQHYLWAAKELYGVEARGVLHQPKGRVIQVSLDEEATMRDHERIREIEAGPFPKPQRLPICRGCTNRYWCWG